MQKYNNLNHDFFGVALAYDTCLLAVEYVMEEFDLYEDEGDDGNPFSHVDWGEGWLWEEEYDVNVCNDRIRIEMHDVK